MILTGILGIVNGESRLDNVTLLARCADPSPLFAATAFVQSAGCQTNDRIQVEGESGVFGSVAVFCIKSAQTVGLATESLQLNISKARVKPAMNKTKQSAKPKAQKQPATGKAVNWQAKKTATRRKSGKQP